MKSTENGSSLDRDDMVFGASLCRNGQITLKKSIRESLDIEMGDTWLGITALDGSLMTGLVPPPIGRFLPQPLESQSVVTDGQWHHVGFVWDGSYRSLYVDGIEVVKDTNILIQPLMSSNGDLYIGTSKNLEAGTFFSGLIDDVRIYDKTLTAEQIQTMAQ